MKHGEYEKKARSNMGNSKEKHDNRHTRDEAGSSADIDKCPEYYELLRHIGEFLRDMTATEIKGGY